MTAFDPGCVKTPKVRKPLEWSFSEWPKSNALIECRGQNCHAEECLFYRSLALPRFYTAKTHFRHQQVRQFSSDVDFDH